MASFKRIVQQTWLAAFVVISAVFIVVFFKDDRHKIARLLDADLRLLGFAVVAQCAYFFATLVTWQKALLFATGKTVSLSESLSQVLLVNFGKYIPGKVWGMAARGKRLSEAGYDLEEITRASYLEQVVLLLTGFALGFLSAALAFGNPLYWLGFALASAGLVLFRYDREIIAMLARVIPQARSLLRFFEVRIGALDVLKLSAGYLLVWLFLAGAFMFVCTSVIDIELTFASGVVFVLSLTAGFLAGFLALFAPGGAGVREGVGAAFLTAIVTLEEAVLLMLWFRVWVVAAELLAGALVLMLPAPGKASRDGDGEG